MKKKKTSLSLKPRTLAALKRAAQVEGRSLSNFLELKIAEVVPMLEAQLAKNNEAAK